MFVLFPIGAIGIGQFMHITHGKAAPKMRELVISIGKISFKGVRTDFIYQNGSETCLFQP